MILNMDHRREKRGHATKISRQVDLMFVITSGSPLACVPCVSTSHQEQAKNQMVPNTSVHFFLEQLVYCKLGYILS